jgi:hypothetical protein
MTGKHALPVERLTVESFETVDQPNGCICDVAPCGCTRAPDCTAM